MHPNNGRRKRTTLGDVAAKAGVSVATASVAITGKPSGNCRVSPTVAERIRRAAHQLNYRPNIYARNLSTQRTQTVAMLVKRSNWHNAMYFLASAQRVLRREGYTEIFLMHEDNQLSTERQHLEMCVDRRVEGIIIMPLIDLNGQTNATLINQIAADETIPLVQLEIAIPDCTAPAIVSDEVEGVRQAVHKLHEMGHRRIAHATLKGYEDANPANPYRHAHLRYLGYSSAIRDLNLDPIVLCPDRLEVTVDAEFDAAVDMAHRIAAMSPRPTAVVTYADFEAAGMLAGLAEAGVSVPRDVSIIGYGDQPFIRMTRPVLSTIAPPYERMGEEATSTLLSMIGGAAAESVQIPPTLMLRQSVASLPA
jgi:LacI family transcriptional regulator